MDVVAFWRAARAISPNVAMFLPRNLDPEALRLLPDAGALVELESNYLEGRLKAVTAYFGTWAR